MTEQGLMTVPEAATQLGISRQSVYRAINEGRLPSVRILGKTAIPTAAVNAYQPRGYDGRPGAKKGGRPRKTD